MEPVSGGDPLLIPTLARELTRRYMIWDSYVGGVRRVALDPLVLPLSLHVAAKDAAESVTRAVRAVSRRAFHDPHERGLYGLSAPVEELAEASHDAGDESGRPRQRALGSWGKTAASTPARATRTVQAGTTRPWGCRSSRVRLDTWRDRTRRSLWKR